MLPRLGNLVAGRRVISLSLATVASAVSKQAITESHRLSQQHAPVGSSRGLLELAQDVVALHHPLLLLLRHFAALHAVQTRILLLDLVGTLGLHLLDEGLLLVSAALAGVGLALNLKVVDYVRLESVEVAAAVVGVALCICLRGEILDRRVARDVVLAAEVRLDGAVDITDNN